jgi:hypothetical protein
MGKTYKNFFLSVFLLQNLCVIYHHRGFSQSTATKTTKTYVVLSFIHSLWHNKNLKIFLSHTKTSSLCGGPQVMYFPFLSLSLSSLCCVIYYPRGRSVHSSKRVTTGPNGLQRVRTGPNGFQRVWRGGEEERSMTRLLSPQYFNNIIYKFIYLKKFYFSI